MLSCASWDSFFSKTCCQETSIADRMNSQWPRGQSKKKVSMFLGIGQTHGWRKRSCEYPWPLWSGGISRSLDTILAYLSVYICPSVRPSSYLKAVLIKSLQTGHVIKAPSALPFMQKQTIPAEKMKLSKSLTCKTKQRVWLVGVGGGGGGEWSDDSCTQLRSLPFHFFQCPLSPIPAVNHRLSVFSPAIIYLHCQNNGFECQVVKKPPCFGTWVVTCCSAGDDPISVGFQFSGPKLVFSHIDLEYFGLLNRDLHWIMILICRKTKWIRAFCQK